MFEASHQSPAWVKVTHGPAWQPSLLPGLVYPPYANELFELADFHLAKVIVGCLGPMGPTVQ